MALFYCGCIQTEEKSVVHHQEKRAVFQLLKWKAGDFFEDAQIQETCNAIDSGDKIRLKKLIDSGINVNTLGNGNMSLLLWSLQYKRVDAFEILLKSGANPNVFFTDDFGMAPEFQAGYSVTHLACRISSDHSKLVFHHGGDPNLVSRAKDLDLRETPLFCVIRSGVEIENRIQLLLELNVDINQRRAKELGGETAVMYAASKGHFEACSFMLKNGADPARFASHQYLTKLIHELASADVSVINSADQKAFNQLVSSLEQRGESIEQAKGDFKRWNDSKLTRVQKRDMKKWEGDQNRLAELSRLANPN